MLSDSYNKGTVFSSLPIGKWSESYWEFDTGLFTWQNKRLNVELLFNPQSSLWNAELIEHRKSSRNGNRSFALRAKPQRFYISIKQRCSLRSLIIFDRNVLSRKWWHVWKPPIEEDKTNRDRKCMCLLEFLYLFMSGVGLNEIHWIQLLSM